MHSNFSSVYSYECKYVCVWQRHSTWICLQNWQQNKNSMELHAVIHFVFDSVSFNLKSLKFTNDANAIYSIFCTYGRHRCRCFLHWNNILVFFLFHFCVRCYRSCERSEKAFRWENLICGCDNVGKRHARFMAELYLWLFVSHLDSFGIWISSHIQKRHIVWIPSCKNTQTISSTQTSFESTKFHVLLSKSLHAHKITFQLCEN